MSKRKRPTIADIKALEEKISLLTTRQELMKEYFDPILDALRKNDLEGAVASSKERPGRSRGGWGVASKYTTSRPVAEILLDVPTFDFMFPPLEAE